MNTLLKIGLALSLVASTSLAMAGKELKTKDFSGWMDDYDSLVFSEDKNAFVFFNEDRRGKYDKVMLQSVTVYSLDA